MTLMCSPVPPQILTMTIWSLSRGKLKPEADYIVSGDSDLLRMNDPKPPVLTPADTYALFESTES